MNAPNLLVDEAAAMLPDAPLLLAHNDVHALRVRDKHLLFHIPSSSLFAIDILCGDVLQLFRERDALHASDVITTLKERHASDDVEQVLRELVYLRILHGAGAAAVEITPQAPEKAPLTTLVLNVNTGCNLSCSYCYKEDLTTPAKGQKMSFDVARQSIEMLLQESPDQPGYSIVFFGGEPLSNMPLIRQVVTFAEERLPALGKGVEFSLTTNATLLKDDVAAYFQEHNFGIAVSMDGPKAWHDKNRITVGGQGTYDLVARRVRRLLANYRAKPVGARVTLTRGVTDLVAIWDHLYNDLGFDEVGFAPVTSGDIAAYNLTEQELAAVFAKMKELGAAYLQAALRNEHLGFANMRQLLTDLHEGTKKALPCGAGVGMVAIDHSGGVNLCHRFTGSELPLFGDVEQGLDHERLRDFLAVRLDRSDVDCAQCRIRNLCAGGCYHESYAKYNDPSKPVYHYCELLRDWVDYGLGVYAEILASNPDFFTTAFTPTRRIAA